MLMVKTYQKYLQIFLTKNMLPIFITKNVKGQILSNFIINYIYLLNSNDYF